MNLSDTLKEIERIFDAGLDRRNLDMVLGMLGTGPVPSELAQEMRLYSEYLPKAAELGFTETQRYMHFLWDYLDRLPIGLAVNFSFPFRRMIAERLFKRCGARFNAEQEVQFNFGQNISVGDDVFINRNAFLDSKGGIEIGNSVGIGERVTIFTHTHSESVHSERTYAPVVIGDFVKVYNEAMILPGVTLGDQSIVAAKSMVTKDVAPNTVVAGIPAEPIRQRRNEGRNGPELDHIWLANGAFQID